jgi:NAD(P)-dependent dehydrogenase (short-subunit alcohol dehydrogenase family)
MIDPHQGLSGRHIIVTGGSRGLGRAMTLALAQAGACVTAVASRSSPQFDETLARARALGAGDRVMALIGDLREWSDCRRIHDQAAERFGPVQVLVNNAGVPMSGPGEPFWRADVDEWQRMVGSNIDGMFLLTRSVAPTMVSQGFGKIVNISTGAATMTRRHFSPYGPSKAFLEAATRIWAQDLAGTGVTANVLLPGGAVDTAADVVGHATPGRQFLPASIMVPPMLWLASDHSNDHTGLRVNAKLWDESLPIGQRLAAANQAIGAEPHIM